MIKVILLVSVFVGLIFGVGKLIADIDQRGYERGHGDASKLAVEAIATQNQQMANLVQKSRQDLRRYTQQLVKERRESDAKVKKLLATLTEFRTWWVTRAHACAIVLIYGVPDKEGCPGLDVPRGPEPDKALTVPDPTDRRDV